MKNENKGFGYLMGQLLGQLTSKGWNITKVVAAIIVVVALYYLISPYQNCLRDTGSHRASYCVRSTSW